MSEQGQVATMSKQSHWLLPVVLFGVFTLDTLLYGIVIPFLPARVLALGANQAVVGILFACYAIGLLVATPLAGWLTNRLGGVRVLGLGLLLLFFSTVVFAFAATLPMLFLARALQGVAAAMPWTAGLAIIAIEYSPAERYQRFAQVFSATSIGTLIGPAIGGVLYTWRGFQAPFLVMAALIIIECIAALAIFGRGARAGIVRPQTAISPAESHEPRPGTQPGNPMGLPRSRRFAGALVLTASGALLLALIEPTLPVLLAERYGLAPLTIGLVFGGMTALFVLVQGLVGALLRGYSSSTAMFFGLTMGPLALVLVAVSSTLVHALVALALLAFSFAFLLTPALEYLTQTARPVPAKKTAGAETAVRAIPYGTLYASYNLAYSTGMLVGPILSGVAITLLGLTYGLIVTGSVLAIAYLPLAIGPLWNSGLHRSSGSPIPPSAPDPGQTLVEELMPTSEPMVEARQTPHILETEETLEIVEIVEIVEIDTFIGMGG